MRIISAHFASKFISISEDSQRNYVLEEENRNRMSYFLVEAADGGYDMEDLTVDVPEVTATSADVVYYFCSQTNINGTYVTTNVTSSLPIDTFDPTKEVLVLVHGWRNDYSSPFNSYIKSAALDKFDLNVIIVDWSVIANNLYIVARNTVPEIGKFAGEFIQSLVSTYNIPFSKISIVGHSLGAHVAGIVGATMDGKIGNIVGLDPASPLISILEKDYILDSSDAQYVQVIHTNGAFLGLSTSLGHSDFYPNGGMKQPGCGLDLTGNCSHGRAYRFYAESISDNKFISQECTSYSDFTQGKCNGTFALMGGYEVNKG